MAFLLDAESVAAIREVVQIVLRQYMNNLGLGGPSVPFARQTITGTLDEPLERGSFASPATAMMTIYKLDPSTGAWSPTRFKAKITETGKLSSVVAPLVASTQVDAPRVSGSWVVVSFDCDA